MLFLYSVFRFQFVLNVALTRGTLAQTRYLTRWLPLLDSKRGVVIDGEEGDTFASN